MILLVRGIESVDIGGQAEVVNACVFPVNSSLSLTQFEALFFSFPADGAWLSADYYFDHFAPGKALVTYK